MNVLRLLSNTPFAWQRQNTRETAQVSVSSWKKRICTLCHYISQNASGPQTILESWRYFVCNLMGQNLSSRRYFNQLMSFDREIVDLNTSWLPNISPYHSVPTGATNHCSAWPVSGVALRFGHRAKESVELLGCEVKELSDSESEKRWISIGWRWLIGVEGGWLMFWEMFAACFEGWMFWKDDNIVIFLLGCASCLLDVLIGFESGVLL